MYTTDCKDPDCSKCKLAARGQCSEEEIPRTAGQNWEEQSEKRLLQILEQDILQNFMSAKRDRQDCLSNSLRVKKKIHTIIYELIKQLKNRELELCLHVDREYEYQVDKIDCYWTNNSTEKIRKKKCNEMTRPTQTSMVFIESCFEILKRTIQKFGMLKYEDGEELPTIRKEMRWYDEGISSKVNNPAEHKIPIEIKAESKVNEEDLKINSEDERQLKVDAKENGWELIIEPTNRMTVNQTEMHIELLDQGDKEYIQLLMEDREQFIQKIEEQECIRRKDFQLWLLKEREKFQAFEEGMKRHLNVDKVTESGTDGKTETDGSSDCKNSVLCEKCGDNWFGKNWIYTRQYVPSNQVIDFINRKLQEKLSDRPTEDAERNEIPSNNLGSKDSAPNKKNGQMDDDVWIDLTRGFVEKLQRFKGRAMTRKSDKILASLLKEDVNTEKIKPQRCEIVDALLREGLEKNSSWLKNRDEMLARRISLLKEDVNTEKIKSQSSESADSLLREEFEKDSSWDIEDDIVIIDRSETDSIPSDVSFSSPLPLKRRFKFDRKPSRLASFLRRKGDAKSPLSPENDVKSESSGIGGCESHAKPLIKIKIGSSTKELENQSSFKQPDQESSGECLSGSKDEGQGNNPTVALRFSFTKYLEKNPEGEWLASGKSSKKVVPIFAREYEEWLTAASNQKRASD